MAQAMAKIYKTTNPSGFAYTFDRTDITDGSIDNAATASSAGAALDAIKALVGGLPGVFSQASISIQTFE